MKTQRRRRFNKFAKSLSEIYNREYKEVEQLYFKMNSDVEATKAILNLTSN